MPDCFGAGYFGEGCGARNGRIQGLIVACAPCCATHLCELGRCHGSFCRLRHCCKCTGEGSHLPLPSLLRGLALSLRRMRRQQVVRNGMIPTLAPQGSSVLFIFRHLPLPSLLSGLALCAFVVPHLFLDALCAASASLRFPRFI